MTSPTPALDLTGIRVGGKVVPRAEDGKATVGGHGGRPPLHPKGHGGVGSGGKSGDGVEIRRTETHTLADAPGTTTVDEKDVPKYEHRARASSLASISSVMSAASVATQATSASGRMVVLERDAEVMMEEARQALAEKALNINSLMSAEAIGKVRSEFQAAERAHGDGSGLSQDEFVKVMVTAAQKLRPGASKVDIVMDLFELFERIDFDGSGDISWDEFTSFCVEAGMTATQADNPPPPKLRITFDETILSAPSQQIMGRITCVRFFPELQYLMVCEENSTIMRVFNHEGRLLVRVHCNLPPGFETRAGPPRSRKAAAAAASGDDAGGSGAPAPRSGVGPTRHKGNAKEKAAEAREAEWKKKVRWAHETVKRPMVGDEGSAAVRDRRMAAAILAKEHSKRLARALEARPVGESDTQRPRLGVTGVAAEPWRLKQRAGWDGAADEEWRRAHAGPGAFSATLETKRMFDEGDGTIRARAHRAALFLRRERLKHTDRAMKQLAKREESEEDLARYGEQREAAEEALKKRLYRRALAEAKKQAELQEFLEEAKAAEMEELERQRRGKTPDDAHRVHGRAKEMLRSTKEKAVRRAEEQLKREKEARKRAALARGEEVEEDEDDGGGGDGEEDEDSKIVIPKEALRSRRQTRYTPGAMGRVRDLGQPVRASGGGAEGDASTRAVHEAISRTSLLSVEYCRPKRRTEDKLKWMKMTPEDAEHLLAVCSTDQTITFWQTRNFLFHSVIHVVEAHQHATWTDTGNCLFTVAQFSKDIYAWDVLTGSKLTRLVFHQEPITALCDIPKDDVLASASEDGAIELWSYGDEKLPRTPAHFGSLVGHRLGVRELVYNERRGVLISVGFEPNEIYIWDVNSRRKVLSIKGNKESVIGVGVSAEAPYHAITADASGTFRLWHIEDMSNTAAPCIHTFRSSRKSEPVSTLVMTHPHKTFLGIGHKFHLFTPRAIEDSYAHPSSILYSAAAEVFVVAAETDVYIYDAHGGNLIDKFLDVTEEPIVSAALDSRGRKLFLGDASGAIKAINVVNGFVLKQALYPHADDVTSISHTGADGNLITVSWDRDLRVYSDHAVDSIPVVRLVENAHDADITASSYSRDLGLIATGSTDGMVRLWDYTDVSLIYQFTGHRDSISDIEFASPGALPLLFTSDASGELIVWAVPPSPLAGWPLLRLVNRGYGGEVPRPHTEVGTPAPSPDLEMELTGAPIPITAIEVHVDQVAEKGKRDNHIICYVLTGDAQGRIKFWDLSSELSQFPVSALSEDHLVHKHPSYDSRMPKHRRFPEKETAGSGGGEGGEGGATMEDFLSRTAGKVRTKKKASTRRNSLGKFAVAAFSTPSSSPTGEGSKAKRSPSPSSAISSPSQSPKSATIGLKLPPATRRPQSAALSRRGKGGGRGKKRPESAIVGRRGGGGGGRGGRKMRRGKGDGKVVKKKPVVKIKRPVSAALRKRPMTAGRLRGGRRGLKKPEEKKWHSGVVTGTTEVTVGSKVSKRPQSAKPARSKGAIAMARLMRDLSKSAVEEDEAVAKAMAVGGKSSGAKDPFTKSTVTNEKVNIHQRPIPSKVASARYGSDKWYYREHGGGHIAGSRLQALVLRTGLVKERRQSLSIVSIAEAAADEAERKAIEFGYRSADAEASVVEDSADSAASRSQSGRPQSPPPPTPSSPPRSPMRGKKANLASFLATRTPPSLTPRASWTAHTDYLTTITFVENPATILSCSQDGSVRLWSLDGTPVGVLLAPPPARPHLHKKPGVGELRDDDSDAGTGAAYNLQPDECPWVFLVDSKEKRKTRLKDAHRLLHDIAAREARMKEAAAAEAEAAAVKAQRTNRLRARARLFMGLRASMGAATVLQQGALEKVRNALHGAKAGGAEGEAELDEIGAPIETPSLIEVQQLAATKAAVATETKETLRERVDASDFYTAVDHVQAKRRKEEEERSDSEAVARRRRASTLVGGEMEDELPRGSDVAEAAASDPEAAKMLHVLFVLQNFRTRGGTRGGILDEIEGSHHAASPASPSSSHRHPSSPGRKKKLKDGEKEKGEDSVALLERPLTLEVSEDGEEIQTMLERYANPMQHAMMDDSVLRVLVDADETERMLAEERQNDELRRQADALERRRMLRQLLLAKSSEHEEKRGGIHGDGLIEEEEDEEDATLSAMLPRQRDELFRKLQMPPSMAVFYPHFRHRAAEVSRLLEAPQQRAAQAAIEEANRLLIMTNDDLDFKPKKLSSSSPRRRPASAPATRRPASSLPPPPPPPPRKESSKKETSRTEDGDTAVLTTSSAASSIGGVGEDLRTVAESDGETEPPQPPSSAHPSGTTTPVSSTSHRFAPRLPIDIDVSTVGSATDHHHTARQESVTPRLPPLSHREEKEEDDEEEGVGGGEKEEEVGEGGEEEGVEEMPREMKEAMDETKAETLAYRDIVKEVRSLQRQEHKEVQDRALSHMKRLREAKLASRRRALSPSEHPSVHPVAWGEDGPMSQHDETVLLQGPKRRRPSSASSTRSKVYVDTPVGRVEAGRRYPGKDGHPLRFGEYRRDQVVTLVRMFDSIDADRSGTIDMEEFLNSPQLGSHISGSIAKSLFRALDKDKSGDITLFELLRAAFPDITPVQFREVTSFVRFFRRQERNAHDSIRHALAAVHKK